MAALLLHQFPLKQVAAWLAEGEIVPFIGAGASSVGLPSGVVPDAQRLADEMIRAMGPQYPAGATGLDLTVVSQLYECSVYDRTYLYNFLYDRLEAKLHQVSPGNVARMLAAIPVGDRPLFLMTTNYDTFIERAFQEANRPLCVITQGMRDLKGGATVIDIVRPDGTLAKGEADRFQWRDGTFPPACAFLLKMHGSVHTKNPDGPDDVIITEDDYVHFMVNLGGMTSPFFPPASLAAEYKRRSFLFLGYSLRDWNFRVFLKLLVMRNAISGHDNRRHWAIQRQPSDMDSAIWSSRKVTLVDGNLDVLCTQLLNVWRAGRDGGTP